MDALKVQKADLVTHDIGNMVGYALRGAISDAHYPLGRDRRAASRHRQLGRYRAKPAALALQFPWAG